MAVLGLSVSVLTGAPAWADTPGTPGAPTITSLTTGEVSGELDVVYTAPASAGTSAITSYQVTVDAGTTWLTCSGGTSGTCPLPGLINGQTYSIILRAVNAVGAGASSSAVTGVPTPPAGPDPDKPTPLPAPHTFVSASFNAAGNNLGVRSSSPTVGAGTLPRLTFGHSIPNKRVVETHLKVTATDAAGATSVVPGAWGWVDDRTAVFRPATFWPGDSTITVTSTLDNAVLGRSGSTAIVGSPSLKKAWQFRTGRQLIARVDGAKHRMTVFINGVKVKSFGVSLGQKDWETTNGVKVISSQKEPLHTYTSTALQLTTADDTTNPLFYNLANVPWNTRLTPTGEFIHSAPWASGRIGKWNGSHGCTNMFEKDAKWIYDNTIPGDVVIYTNTGGQTVSSGNGPGGLWNIPWASWLKKSALGNAAGPDTSAPVVDPSQGKPASA